MIRKTTALALASALALSATPALSDTLEEVVKNGIVLSAEGFEIDVDYAEDGTFTAFEGQLAGTWRIDGDKLCTSSDLQPEESCAEYPADKVSGDTFEVTGPDGQSATITIK